MDAMDDYIPSDTEVVEGASQKRPPAVLAAHLISLVLWVAFAMYDIHKNAAGNRAVRARVGAASGKLGVTRFALGLGRLAVFAFAVFFVLYHLCYENILHHTDGMEYLSDWTFVLLGASSGMTAAFSLAPGLVGSVSSGNLADLCVVAHSVVWPTNILSTVGAWYSFVFFPQCVALEGVDNYPWCYLEWYRLAEHGLNMVVLGLDWYFGAVPVRRGDLGHTLVFMGAYTVWTWYLQITTGKCPYVMFDFTTGWTSVAWFNAAMAGVTAAFFLVKRAFDARDAQAGAIAEKRDEHERE